MHLPTWEPGSAGLVYIPEEGSKPRDRNRPYYVADIDEKGFLEYRDKEKSRSWTDAYNRTKELAAIEKKKAFSLSTQEDITRLTGQGFLKRKSSA